MMALQILAFNLFAPVRVMEVRMEPTFVLDLNHYELDNGKLLHLVVAFCIKGSKMKQRGMAMKLSMGVIG